MLKARLTSYAARRKRFRRLRQVGVDTARLVRTGSTAMTYGVATSGVSDSMLDMQRRVAAALASPGAGSGGQNVDLALFLADGNSKGRADPAYAAHMDVIGQWAAAVWNQLVPLWKKWLEEQR